MSENMTQLPPYDELVRRPELWPCVKAMVERLQAIVDKYPKTKDGVAITPKMHVWHPFFGEVLITTIANDNQVISDLAETFHKSTLFYSTPQAAAEAARETKC